MNLENLLEGSFVKQYLLPWEKIIYPQRLIVQYHAKHRYLFTCVSLSFVVLSVTVTMIGFTFQHINDKNMKY
jgi:hypothetical protein